MRVTTQMLNASFRKAGLPLNQTSLLDCINGSKKNNIFSALDKNKITGNKAYEKLKDTAEDLRESAQAFTSGEIFEEARKSGDYQKVYGCVEKLVKNYNDTMKALQNSSSPLDQYYRQTLSESALEDEKSLQEIGITRQKDGTLKLDEDKLKAASPDALEKSLGASQTFTSKLSFLADKVADNAKANASSASSQYNAFGGNYFAEAGKFDLWG